MPEERNALKVYRLKKPEGSDKWIKEIVQLDPEKSYYLLFINKTRSNESDTCLLYEANLALNSWREVGWCSPKRDYVKTY